MSTDAIALLKQDHETVKGMLEKLSETTPRATKTRTKLLTDIEKELKIHTQIEEEIFYPAFKEDTGQDGATMYYEAVEEHRAVEDLLLPDLKSTDPSSVEFSGRAKVLKELVEHHLQDEEKEMFPKAKKEFSKDQLNELGARLDERKKALKKEL